MQQLKDLMSRDVKVISPDMTIGEAAKKCATAISACCLLEKMTA